MPLVKKHVLHLVMAISAAFVLMPLHALSQGLPIGHWRHHLPNNRIIAITETPDRIIGASPYALLLYNKEDNSISKFDKVQGLSDFGITTIAFAEAHKLLVVGYENGNIDIVRDDKTTNIPDIRMASIIGSKKINHITIVGNMAYLSCDFGIVELNLNNLLINDTFYIGPDGGLVSVYGLVHTGSHFFAATNQGVITASAQAPNLADYKNWQRMHITGLPNEVFTRATYHNGRVIVNLSNQQGDFLYHYDGMGWQLFNPWNDNYNYRKPNITSSGGQLLICNNVFLDIFDENLSFVRRVQTYENADVRALDALIDHTGTLWIGDQFEGLVREISTGTYEHIILPGPPTANAFGLGAGGGKIWVAPGNISRGGSNTWNQDGVFIFEDEKWSSYSRWTVDALTSVWDIIRITPDPSNPTKAIATTWTSGILEISTTGVENRFDHTNSTLRRRFEIEDFTRIGGVAFDRKGNLWVTNSQVERPLSVKKPNGQWLSFAGSGYVGSSQVVGNIIIDQSDQKWIALHQGGGIFLFSENSLDVNNDFKARRLTTSNGLPSNEVFSLAVDRSGYVWVGTDAGVAVFYAPSRAFSGDAFNAQLIIVDQDGFGGYLFEDETINAITVDGSNKKWFGTTRSGAFLLSADARETMFNFNTNNSPLPSNNILDIAIDEITGEVFFATDKGLVSFRGLATAGSTTHTDVYAYPNPVRPGYNGYIAIKGLVTNALIKITDINGNLVHETISEGGQAVWNGQDLFGRRPATGVYLVFSTNEDGSETMVTKVLFIN
jgi:hypothetical protein